MEKGDGNGEGWGVGEDQGAGKFVAIKMEKGDGNGEGWGVGKDQGAGKWKVGLFESYKPSLGCLLGCYCPPIGNFMVAEKIPGMGMWKWLGFVDCCCPTFGIATCVLNMMLRDKIREKDGIEGSFCDDCLSASLCCLCSVCQTYNQVKMDGTEGISFDDRFKASCCLPCLPCYACLTYNM